MISTIFGLLPTALALKVGAVSSLNNRVIIPLSTGLARTITTSTGILTEEEADQQTQLFYDYISPVTGIFKELEDEVIGIITNNWDRVIDVILPTSASPDKVKTWVAIADLKEPNPEQPIITPTDDPMWLYHLRKEALELEGVAKNVD